MLKSTAFILSGIGCAIFLIFAYGRIGQVPMDKAVLIVIAVFFMLYSARAFEVEMKYKSPKFVSDPVHSTANWSDARLIGKYAVVRLGAFDAYGFKYSGGNEGTAVIRIDALNKTGESISATCKLRQITMEELPPEVFMEKEYLNLTEPLYRGDISTNEALKSVKHSTIESEIAEKDKHINLLKDLLDGKTEAVEKFVEGSSRVIERRKGVGAFLKGLLNDNPNQDEE